MSISINARACTACGACTRVCPGNLIRQRTDGVAVIRHPENCWGCTACLKECPSGAIVYFLGADMGGRGTTLGVESTPEHAVWTFARADGTRSRITIDKKQANKY